jgi:hypothetical protein
MGMLHNIFQRFFLGTMSKDFLKSTTQQKILVLVLWNSFAMILKVIRWSTVELLSGSLIRLMDSWYVLLVVIDVKYWRVIL